jgi:hypothetical protein
VRLAFALRLLGGERARAAAAVPGGTGELISRGGLGIRA